MGIGAAPEGVISAAAMRCLGGHFQGQLIYDPEVVKTGLIGESKEGNLARLKEMGIEDPDRVYNDGEIAGGENGFICRLRHYSRHSHGRSAFLQRWSQDSKPWSFLVSLKRLALSIRFICLSSQKWCSCDSRCQGWHSQCRLQTIKIIK